MYAGALTIFCILFGLGVSPLPGSAAESFSTRVGFVLFAIVYTVTLAALVWRAPEAGTGAADRGGADRLALACDVPFRDRNRLPSATLWHWWSRDRQVSGPGLSPRT
jgi:hypothetical protein